MIGLPRYLGILFLVIWAYSFSSCTTAALSTGLNGRSLKKGNSEFSSFATFYENYDEGSLAIVPSVRYMTGVTDKLDLGFYTEFNSYGLLAKYSIIDQGEIQGFSLAAILSTFTLTGQLSHYIGGVGSYCISRRLEPFLALRYASLRIDRSEIDMNSPFFTNKTSADDFFINAGFQFWLRQDTALGIDLALPPSGDSGLIKSKTFPSLFMAFQF